MNYNKDNIKGSPAISPERQPMVPAILKDIECALGSLHAQISELKNRLAPVMSGMSGIDEAKQPRPPANCELVGKLQDFNLIIGNAVDEIAQIKRDLEI